MATFETNFLVKLHDGTKEDYDEVMQFLGHSKNVQWNTASLFGYLLVRKDGSLGFPDIIPRGLLGVLTTVSLEHFRRYCMKPQISIGEYYGTY